MALLELLSKNGQNEERKLKYLSFGLKLFEFLSKTLL